jgi:PAS domain-containing protein
MNDSLIEFEKSLKKSHADSLLNAILQNQTKKYHADINSCWINGTVYSAFYSIHSKSYQLYFTPYCYEKNALAGFQIEIKEIESSINTLSMEELSLFPLKNPLPVLRISKQAELLFANAAAVNKFCNKDGRLKKDIQYQFETAIAFAEANNEAQFFRIEISDVVLSTVLQKVSTHFHVYCSDITEIAKAERKNEDNMALMDAIVNSASNSIILLNQNRKVTFFNQKAKIESRRHFGYQLIHGEELPDFDEIGFTQTLNRSVDAVFKGGKQISFDIELSEQEQGLLWFNFTVFPVMNHIGIVNSVCLNILNITRSKNAEIEISDT